MHDHEDKVAKGIRLPYRYYTLAGMGIYSISMPFMHGITKITIHKLKHNLAVSRQSACRLIACVAPKMKTNIAVKITYTYITNTINQTTV